MNLLEETIDDLKLRGKSEADVLFVTDEKAWCDWDTFKAGANFEYDDGFGGQEINANLKIVGADWWLERHEYDGSECWHFKTMPIKPDSKSFVEYREV